MEHMDAATNITAPAISAEAHGTGSYPEHVVVTIDGAEHTVDVTPDRDDWSLPEVADGHEHRLLWAIDDAIELYLTDSFGPAPGRTMRAA